MAFTNETVKQSYQGNGTTTTFAIPFTVIDSAADETVVYLRNTDVDPPSEALQSYTTHYTISGSNVVFVIAPSADQIVVIKRNIDTIQELDLVTAGSFQAAAHELQFDKVVGMIQELNERVDRAPTMPVTNQAIVPLELPEPEANRVLAWNSAGTALENVDPPSVITVTPEFAFDVTTTPVSDVVNYSLVPTLAGNALTITMKAADGSDLSASNAAYAMFRTSAAGPAMTSGAQLFKSITANLSVTIPSTKTLGHVSTYSEPVFVYLLWDVTNSTFRLAVAATRLFDDGYAEQTAATSSATTRTGLFSDSASGVCSVKLIGYLLSTQATAGTWVTTPSIVASRPPSVKYHNYNEYWYSGGGGHGSGASRIMYFTTLQSSKTTTGGALFSNFTKTNSSTDGFSHLQTKMESIWQFEFTANFSAAAVMGFSLNATSGELGTNIYSLAQGKILTQQYVESANIPRSVTCVVRLKPGDIVRPHTNGVSLGSDTTAFIFRATELGVG